MLFMTPAAADAMPLSASASADAGRYAITRRCRVDAFAIAAFAATPIFACRQPCLPFSFRHFRAAFRRFRSAAMSIRHEKAARH